MTGSSKPRSRVRATAQSTLHQRDALRTRAPRGASRVRGVPGPERHVEAGALSNLPHVALAAYLAWLMLRYRSLTIFTAANPGIESGGVVGESKSASLRALSTVPGAVAPFVVVDPAAGCAAAVEAARSWMRRSALAYPLVVKPDVGERGAGVAVVRSDPELRQALGRMGRAAIVQRRVAGVEFGLFYVRRPGEATGRVVSIGEVRYATGAAAKASGMGFECARRMHYDRRALRTPALVARVDALARAHPGFHFGRFDVIAPSADALRQGRFQVIELNGVIAEPLHVYDPRTGLVDRARTLMRTWTDAFEIAEANRREGAQPMRSGALARRLVAKLFDSGAVAPESLAPQATPSPSRPRPKASTPARGRSRGAPPRASSRS